LLVVIYELVNHVVTVFIRLHYLDADALDHGCSTGQDSASEGQSQGQITIEIVLVEGVLQTELIVFDLLAIRSRF